MQDNLNNLQNTENDHEGGQSGRYEEDTVFEGNEFVLEVPRVAGYADFNLLLEFKTHPEDLTSDQLRCEKSQILSSRFEIDMEVCDYLLAQYGIVKTVLLLEVFTFEKDPIDKFLTRYGGLSEFNLNRLLKSKLPTTTLSINNREVF